MILVSHDWGVIADSCDAALVMYAGQVVEEALIDSVFDEPRHPYSYGLMQSNPHLAVAPRSVLAAVPRHGAQQVAGRVPLCSALSIRDSRVFHGADPA